VRINAWKLGVLALAFACLCLAYRVVDLGISRTYQSSSLDSANSRIELLEGVIERDWHGLSRIEVEGRLSAYVAAHPDKMMVLKYDQESNSLNLDGVNFEFSKNKLERVR
jgi:Immunity protein 58